MFRYEKCNVYVNRKKINKVKAHGKKPWANLFELFCFREIVLAYSAKRTLKVFGKILELRAGIDAVIRIAELLIVFPSAYIT